MTEPPFWHSGARMTTLNTGEIPLKDVQVAFFRVAYRRERLKLKMRENGKPLKSL